MTANEIVIRIYNQRTLRADIGEQLIKEYAMNVAHQGYLNGYEDGYGGIKPDPQVSLSEIEPDNYNK